MKRQGLIFCLVLLVPMAVFGQEVLLEENVAADTVPENYGPNERHYVHVYYQIGAVVGSAEGDSLEVMPGLSYEMAFGLRYKLRVTSWYALGLDLNVRNTRYRITQARNKNFPNTDQHKREALVDNTVALGVYQRFNFEKRGNVIGTYLDMGAYGSYGFAARHRYVNKLEQPNADGAKVSRVVNRNLDYLNAANYGVKARFGSGIVALYGAYRLSNLIQENRGFGEVPRMTIGLEIGGIQ